MAKQPAKKDDFQFDIPVSSLAKVEAKEGSAKWMKELALEHGSTDEGKLEKRRKCLSAFLISMQEHLKQLQTQKRLFLADSQRREKEVLAAIGKAEAQSEAATQLQNQLSNILMLREQQKTQFGMLINQQVYQMAMLDAQCLCVDMMSIQIRGVEGKGGKKGTIRASMSVYAMDAAQEAARIYRRVRKVSDALCAAHGIVLPTTDPEDFGDDEPDEYEDDEVVNDQDVRQIKKDVTGGDDDEQKF